LLGLTSDFAVNRTLCRGGHTITAKGRLSPAFF
jgi:hypothetical protein